MLACVSRHDVAATLLFGTLIVADPLYLRDYAISNDEEVRQALRRDDHRLCGVTSLIRRCFITGTFIYTVDCSMSQRFVSKSFFLLIFTKFGTC